MDDESSGPDDSAEVVYLWRGEAAMVLAFAVCVALFLGY